ncbi:glycosyltransferase [Kribbella capetownensis]|nr:nucleotide disphospho-sugar-binding domain-containing protein [Kribbella capetownensis]
MFNEAPEVSSETGRTQAAGRLLSVVQVLRDGGGTAPVELIVASKLRERGHQVRLFGPPEVREYAEAAGFDLAVLEWPGRPDARVCERMIPRMIEASVAWGRQLEPHLCDGVDLLVADCLAFGALMAAKKSDVPSVAIRPTVYIAGGSPSGVALVGDRGAAVDGLNRARESIGLPPVESVTEQMLDIDRLLVLTARAFELPEVQPPRHVRYVGPQFRSRGTTSGYRLPEGNQPLVLVSLSTTDQGQLDLLQRLLDALAVLPVRAVATLGQAVDPERLCVPDNSVLERYVPHAEVLPDAAFMITHAGHGTVMAASAAGVPMVCVPMGRDQPAVAARVTAHGLGSSVEPGSSATELRTAITEVLQDPTYRETTHRIAKQLEPANRVVAELEAAAAAQTR